MLEQTYLHILFLTNLFYPRMKLIRLLLRIRNLYNLQYNCSQPDFPSFKARISLLPLTSLTKYYTNHRYYIVN